jgi:hypothetical protein
MIGNTLRITSEKFKTFNNPHLTEKGKSFFGISYNLGPMGAC